MGMAASQARFLGLTARKTNVEYEGQQVNQQRTTLGNQSANYYNQLLGMTVPQPPSVADFTKTVYSFDNGALSCSISSMIAQANGQYTVSYTQSYTNPFSIVSANSALINRVVKPEDNTDPSNIIPASTVYKVGNQELRQLGTGIDKNADGTYSYSGSDTYLKNLSSDQLGGIYDQEQDLITQLDGKFNTKDWYVRYAYNSTANTASPVFYNLNTVQNAKYGDDSVANISQSSIPAYQQGAAQETTEIKGVKSTVEQDSTGRLINITLNADDPSAAQTFALTTNTLTDQAAYNDAMNQYEYDKARYDQSIQEVNSKIAIIQAQDKNLELRLKQLDTEHDAISTEMDAVQKVIQKNVESTFKTFG